MNLNIANSRNTWPKALRGKQCIIYREGPYLDEAKKKYGRENQDNLCLKIFNVPMERTLKEYDWGTPWRSYSRDRCEEIGRLSKLYEATVVQNICAMNGFAPRVYALYIIYQEGKEYPVQLVDYIEGKREKLLRRCDELDKLGEEYGFLTAHTDLIADSDFIGDQLIDFQGFRFNKNFKQQMTIKIAELGKYGNYHYQSIPELGLKPHPRDTTKRIEYMKLADIDWEGKAVLDVGCSNGVFLNYAAEHGAKSCFGIDQEEPILASKLLSNYLGHFNIDYTAEDIKILPTLYRILLKNNFDIVLFLSMNIHVGFPQWVKDSAKELLIFEENAKGSRFVPDKWKEELKKDFKSVEIIGYGKDHGMKPIYWCKK